MEHGFYITFLGEKLCQQELAKLVGHFPLLRDKKMVKRLEVFLKSPYLVKEERLWPLFSKVYLSYTKGSNIQGKRLLQEIDLPVRLVAGEKALKRLLKLLTKALVRFYTLEFYQGSSLEQTRLTAKALSYSGQQALHRTALRQWDSQLSQTKAGLTGTLHAWEFAAANHFDFSIPKEQANTASLRKLKEATQQLSAFTELLFVTEEAARRHFFNDVPLPQEAFPESILLELYTKAKALYVTPGFSAENYQALRDSIIRQSAALSDARLYALIGLSLNYLLYHKRSGVAGMRERIFAWTTWQLAQPNLYPSFPVLTRMWLLNQIHNAVDLGEDTLAGQLLDKYLTRIPLPQRASTLHHATAIRKFGQEQHEEVYRMVTEALQSPKLGQHTDRIRLKSLRIRSALCAYINSLRGIAPEYDEQKEDEKYAQFQVARRDFENFLSDKRKLLSPENFRFLQYFLNVNRKFFDRFASVAEQEQLYSELKPLIETPEPPHGQRWFRCLLWHFEPGYKQERLPLRPSLNQPKMVGPP